MSTTIDEQFIEYIVKSLVGNPDEVKMVRTIDEKGVLLELTVDPEDLGRVIGKRGATAQSLRTLLRALGTKNDARYNLKIIDNGVPKPEREQRQSSGEERRSDSNDNDSWSSDDGGTVEDVQSEISTASSEKQLDAQEDDHDTVMSKTRKELEDLDDLDV